MGVLLNVCQLVVVEAPIGIVVGIVAVDGADEPAIELVKAPVQGCGIWAVAVQMPLVDQTGAIACRTQHGGDGGILGQQVGTPYDGGVAAWRNFQSRQSALVALVVTDARVATVLACHQ